MSSSNRKKGRGGKKKTSGRSSNSSSSSNNRKNAGRNNVTHTQTTKHDPLLSEINFNLHNFDDFSSATSTTLTKRSKIIGPDVDKELLEAFCRDNAEVARKMSIPVRNLREIIDRTIACEQCRNAVAGDQGLGKCLAGGMITLTDMANLVPVQNSSARSLEDLECGESCENNDSSGTYHVSLLRDKQFDNDKGADSDDVLRIIPHIFGDGTIDASGASRPPALTPQFISATANHLRFYKKEREVQNEKELREEENSRYRNFTSKVLSVQWFSAKLRLLQNECNTSKLECLSVREQWHSKVSRPQSNKHVSSSSPWTQAFNKGCTSDFDPFVHFYFRYDDSMKDWLQFLSSIVLDILKSHRFLHLPDDKNEIHRQCDYLFNDSNAVFRIMEEHIRPMLMSVSTSNKHSHSKEQPHPYFITDNDISDLWNHLASSLEKLRCKNSQYYSDFLAGENTTDLNKLLMVSPPLREAYAAVLRLKFGVIFSFHDFVTEYCNAIIECRPLSSKNMQTLDKDEELACAGYQVLSDDDMSGNIPFFIHQFKQAYKIVWEDIYRLPQFAEGEFYQSILNDAFDTQRKPNGESSSTIVECEELKRLAINAMKLVQTKMKTIKIKIPDRSIEKFKVDFSSLSKNYETKLREFRFCGKLIYIDLEVSAFSHKVRSGSGSVDGRNNLNCKLNLFWCYHHILHFYMTFTTLRCVVNDFENGILCTKNVTNIQDRLKHLATLSMFLYFEEKYRVWFAEQSEKELLKELDMEQNDNESIDNEIISDVQKVISRKGKKIKKKKSQNMLSKHDISREPRAAEISVSSSDEESSLEERMIGALTNSSKDAPRVEGRFHDASVVFSGKDDKGTEVAAVRFHIDVAPKESIQTTCHHKNKKGLRIEVEDSFCRENTIKEPIYNEIKIEQHCEGAKNDADHLSLMEPIQNIVNNKHQTKDNSHLEKDDFTNTYAPGSSPAAKDKKCNPQDNEIISGVENDQNRSIEENQDKVVFYFGSFETEYVYGKSQSFGSKSEPVEILAYGTKLNKPPEAQEDGLLIPNTATGDQDVDEMQRSEGCSESSREETYVEVESDAGHNSVALCNNSSTKKESLNEGEVVSEVSPSDLDKSDYDEVRESTFSPYDFDADGAKTYLLTRLEDVCTSSTPHQQPIVFL